MAREAATAQHAHAHTYRPLRLVTTEPPRTTMTAHGVWGAGSTTAHHNPPHPQEGQGKTSKRQPPDPSSQNPPQR